MCVLFGKTYIGVAISAVICDCWWYRMSKESDRCNGGYVVVVDCEDSMLRARYRGSVRKLEDH